MVAPVIANGSISQHWPQAYRPEARQWAFLGLPELHLPTELQSASRLWRVRWGGSPKEVKLIDFHLLRRHCCWCFQTPPVLYLPFCISGDAP